ncbi:MAG: ABC transporter ATP-binding protein, partial [Clostridiales bacterium]|nr:ABC transporter ATP-binding protein [Clostridiales bacterium]
MATEEIKVEKDLIKEFEKNKYSSMKLLLSIYKGNYGKLFISSLFFAIKHTPAWALPIAIAGIVDVATNPGDYGIGRIYIYAVIIFFLILQNIPTNYVHVTMYSKAIRNVEAKLRESLIRKLQQLSISYHKSIQSGRLQSKIMRDVEAVETMSTQSFTNLLSIGINVLVAFLVIISKNRLVFLFFLVTIHIAVITILVFRKQIRLQNTEFRKEMEETSAKVIEMVDMIPVTRAYSVEKMEIDRLNTQ